MSNKRIFYLASSNEKLSYPSNEDQSAGIYICTFDSSDGRMEILSRDRTIPACQYLALSPDKNYLYATWLNGEGKPGNTSSVNAFSVNAETGGLTFINNANTLNNSPCYIKVDATGKNILGVNYNSADDQGSVYVFKRNDNGSIGEMTSFIKHEGSSVNAIRQQNSHPHMIFTDPTNQVVLVPDLGTDHVWLYNLKHESGEIIPHHPPRLPIHAGGGPRHLTFHPGGQYLYVINELDSTITVFHWGTNRYTEIETVPTIPADFDGESYCADIHITPSGDYLYGSNRGHESLVIYRIDQSTGKLMLVGNKSTQGSWPRGFTLDPSGEYAIVANQRTHEVVSFRIDRATGDLTATGHQIIVPGPIAIPAFL